MIGNRTQQQTNTHRETVTERLERLRLEHRRHLRNVSNQSGSYISATPIARVQMSPLPEVNAVALTNTVDTWNINEPIQAIRPRPNRLNHAPPPVAAVNAPRAPVSGPPPPRSWTNRPTPVPASHARRISQMAPQRLHISSPGAKPTRRRRVAISREDEERRQEDLMEEAYGTEYWFRRAGDARWNKWREDALELAISHSGVAGSPKSVDRRVKHIFTPFHPVADSPKLPTLFETILKFIFGTLKQNEPAEDRYREELFNLLRLLPTHIQKSVLRYAAAHSPFSNEQLRVFYSRNRESELNAGQDRQEVGLSLGREIVLSGRGADVTLIEDLKDTVIRTESKAVEVGDRVSPHTIILFQVANLNKRHLNVFPKTLTTLALVALPPPLSYRPSQHNAAQPSILGPETLDRQCLCPWCSTTGTSQGRSRDAKGSTKSTQTCPHPSPAETPTSILPTLVELPSLLPSLVTLDVSYNPWLSSEHAIQTVKIRRMPHHQSGFGVLSRWDLRLWGKLKVLGIRGCFTVPSFNDKGSRIALSSISDQSSFGGPTLEAEIFGGASLESFDFSYEAKPQLVEKWERLLYAIGRQVDVVWLENSYADHS